MVDLVKIRRKAKEKKEKAEEEARAAAAAESGTGTTEEPEPPTPVERSKRPRSKRSPRKDASSAEPAPAVSASVADEATTGTRTDAPAFEEPPEARDRLEEFRRTAGRRRDALLEIDVEQVATDDSGRIEVLVFGIGNERYAVEIERIREITRPRSLTRVPNAAESVLGIISLRGTIVTILDVRRRLGHRKAAAVDDDTRIIVVAQEGEIAGFVVDRVYRVLAIDSASVEANPVVNSAEQNRYIRGVFRYSDRITILLDLERMLGDDDQ